MNEMETDVLAGLICSKRDCLTQLRDMGRRQLETIDEGDMTSLLDILAAKQQWLARLRQIERALDPFRNQDPESRQWRTPEDRGRCARQIAECEQLLSEIIRQEKRGERAMVRRRDEAATRLQAAHFAGHARGAYAEQSQNTINQLDLNSET